MDVFPALVSPPLWGEGLPPGVAAAGGQPVDPLGSPPSGWPPARMGGRPLAAEQPVPGLMEAAWAVHAGLDAPALLAACQSWAQRLQGLGGGWAYPEALWGLPAAQGPLDRPRWRVATALALAWHQAGGFGGGLDVLSGNSGALLHHCLPCGELAGWMALAAPSGCEDPEMARLLLEHMQEAARNSLLLQGPPATLPLRQSVFLLLAHAGCNEMLPVDAEQPVWVHAGKVLSCPGTVDLLFRGEALDPVARTLGIEPGYWHRVCQQGQELAWRHLQRSGLHMGGDLPWETVARRVLAQDTARGVCALQEQPPAPFAHTRIPPRR